MGGGGAGRGGAHLGGVPRRRRPRRPLTSRQVGCLAIIVFTLVLDALLVWGIVALWHWIGHGM